MDGYVNVCKLNIEPLFQDNVTIWSMKYAPFDPGQMVVCVWPRNVLFHSDHFFFYFTPNANFSYPAKENMEKPTLLEK